MESVLLLVHSRRRFVPVVQDNAEITRFEEHVDFIPDLFSFKKAPPDPNKNPLLKKGFQRKKGSKEFGPIKQTFEKTFEKSLNKTKNKTFEKTFEKKFKQN